MPQRRRLTVYLKPKLFRAAKLRAAKGKRSVSAIVSEIVEGAPREDELDLVAIREREDEPSRPVQEIVREWIRARKIWRPRQGQRGEGTPANSSYILGSHLAPDCGVV